MGDIYGPEYLRDPAEDGFKLILDSKVKPWLPGML